MAIGVNWAEVWAPVWKAVWTQTPPVQVPDVVGQTQADGTNALEADGFVVAVATAYSSVVAAGLIISQDPVAGSTPGTGATVTITVSLGPEPSQEGRTPAGGYDIHRKPSKADEERDEDRRQLRAVIDAALAGNKPLSQATKAVIAAETAVLAQIPAADLLQLLAAVAESRARASTIAKLEAALAAAEQFERVMRDDDELIELLGASGLLQ
jgi:hypothetical protein